jgi:hypothetical protein
MMALALVAGLGLPSAPPTASPTASLIAIESVDVQPAAVVAVARADGRPGPCGPRTLLVVARVDIDAFVAGRPVATSPLPAERWPVEVTAAAGPSLLLPLWAGPGLFAGEDQILSLSIDAALAKAKVMTTARTQLVWRDRLPFLRIATSAPANDVTTALRAFVPTTAQLADFASVVAHLRLGQARQPGARALERLDARLCLSARADETTTELGPAVVRAALSAPLQPG